MWNDISKKRICPKVSLNTTTECRHEVLAKRERNKPRDDDGYNDTAKRLFINRRCPRLRPRSLALRNE